MTGERCPKCNAALERDELRGRGRHHLRSTLRGQLNGRGIKTPLETFLDKATGLLYIRLREVSK